MQSFLFRIRARKLGAIGLLDYFMVRVNAVNYESARLKLYETYEHISIVEVHPTP